MVGAGTGHLALDRPGDPEVALPEPASVVGGPALTDAEVAALRDQVDPARLRCTPRPCEAWRRQRGEVSQVATHGDTVVLLEPARVVALDATTGDERWVAPLDELLAVTGDGDPVQRLDGDLHALLRADERGVLVAGGGRILLLDADDGRRRWRVNQPGWNLWDARLLDEVIVLQGHTDRGGSPYERVLVLDLADGSPRWDRDVFVTHVVDPSAVVVGTADGVIEALDPVTGTSRWRQDGDADRWANVVGRWLLLTAPGSSLVLDPASGEERAHLDGMLSSPVVEGDAHTVFVLQRDRSGVRRADSDAAVHLVAIGADGAVAWRLPLGDDDEWCCAGLAIDAGVVTAQGQTRTLRVDAGTGDLLAQDVVEGAARAASWIASDGTTVRWLGDGIVLERPEGSQQVRGSDLWIESERPWVVGSPRELLGLRPPGTAR